MFYCVYEAQKINVWQAMVKKSQIIKQNPFFVNYVKDVWSCKIIQLQKLKTGLVAKSKLIKEI